MELSPFHFSRRFKSIVGTPPMKYFMRLKMKKACFLLESSSLKVKEIGKHLALKTSITFPDPSRCASALRPGIMRMVLEALRSGDRDEGQAKRP